MCTLNTKNSTTSTLILALTPSRPVMMVSMTQQAWQDSTLNQVVAVVCVCCVDNEHNNNVTEEERM